VLVEVRVPLILADSVGGRPTFLLEASTIADAIDRMRQAYPLLRVHLFDESGNLRQHVVLFYNGENIRWLDSLDLPLREGDTIQVLQAVSGG
jgi:molybdopterin converting factor small subunit